MYILVIHAARAILMCRIESILCIRRKVVSKMCSDEPGKLRSLLQSGLEDAFDATTRVKILLQKVQDTHLLVLQRQLDLEFLIFELCQFLIFHLEVWSRRMFQRRRGDKSRVSAGGTQPVIHEALILQQVRRKLNGPIQKMQHLSPVPSSGPEFRACLNEGYCESRGLFDDVAIGEAVESHRE